MTRSNRICAYRLRGSPRVCEGPYLAYILSYLHFHRTANSVQQESGLKDCSYTCGVPYKRTTNYDALHRDEICFCSYFVEENFHGRDDVSFSRNVALCKITHFSNLQDTLNAHGRDVNHPLHPAPRLKKE